jgi:UDP-N-acetylmuramoyl-tripeptide--D-alanyl-D-alanine ligase
MLQSSEYQAAPYLRWYWRARDFNAVQRRRSLDRTRSANLLLAALLTGMLGQLLIGLGLLALYFLEGKPAWPVGLALALSYPVVWAHLVVLFLWLGRLLIAKPRQRRAIRRSETIFAAHPGVKVAVAGSYGKTSMKELLATVLGEARKVAATPANRNVASSHAQFATRLAGDEDVLILEYGEGRPGDIARFAAVTHPTHGIITGLAPAHLDHYRTLEAAAHDIFSLSAAVTADKLYVNASSYTIRPFITGQMRSFDEHQVLGWKVSGIKVATDGISFNMKQGKRRLKLRSGLVGRHQVAPLAFAAAFAIELGLREDEVVAGIARTTPYEHRMQPYRLSGAWIIDDTYNGNLEGVRAGTALLHELQAERKWYVTPGLVDQGRDTARIHREMGTLIAAAKPDTVVLMQNSVTRYIVAGLQAGEFKGELRIEADPLHFYTNLRHFVAAGDLVLMQNDWTDNYA